MKNKLVFLLLIMIMPSLCFILVSCTHGKNSGNKNSSNLYKLFISKQDGCYVNVNEIKSYEEGEIAEFSVKILDGYKADNMKVSVDSGELSKKSDFVYDVKFENKNINIKINGILKIDYYQLLIPSIEEQEQNGYFINIKNNKFTYKSGENVDFNIIVSSNFNKDKLEVFHNNIKLQSSGDLSYTFNFDKADETIQIKGLRKYYKLIFPNQQEGYTITVQKYIYLENDKFKFTLNILKDYKINLIIKKDNGGEHSITLNKDNTYSDVFKNSDIEIKINTEKITYYKLNFNISQGCYVTVTNNKFLYINGERATFSVNILEGYDSSSLKVKNGDDVLNEENNLYSIEFLNNDITIDITIDKSVFYKLELPSISIQNSNGYNINVENNKFQYVSSESAKLTVNVLNGYNLTQNAKIVAKYNDNDQKIEFEIKNNLCIINFDVCKNIKVISVSGVEKLIKYVLTIPSSQEQTSHGYNIFVSQFVYNEGDNINFIITLLNGFYSENNNLKIEGVEIQPNIVKEQNQYKCTFENIKSDINISGITGISKYFHLNLPNNQIGYNIELLQAKYNSFKKNDKVDFLININLGYSVNDNFQVKENEQPLTPIDSTINKYEIIFVDSDITISIIGVEKLYQINFKEKLNQSTSQKIETNLKYCDITFTDENHSKGGYFQGENASFDIQITNNHYEIVEVNNSTNIISPSNNIYTVTFEDKDLIITILFKAKAKYSLILPNYTISKGYVISVEGNKYDNYHTNDVAKITINLLEGYDKSTLIVKANGIEISSDVKYYKIKFDNKDINISVSLKKLFTIVWPKYDSNIGYIIQITNGEKQYYSSKDVVIFTCVNILHKFDKIKVLINDKEVEYNGIAYTIDNSNFFMNSSSTREIKIKIKGDENYKYYSLNLNQDIWSGYKIVVENYKENYLTTDDIFIDLIILNDFKVEGNYPVLNFENATCDFVENNSGNVYKYKIKLSNNATLSKVEGISPNNDVKTLLNIKFNLFYNFKFYLEIDKI